DNKLITRNAIGTLSSGNTYTGISGAIQSGRNGNSLPLWDGKGLVTTMTDATTSNYTTLGVATAAQVKNIASNATAMWAGQTVTGSQTLVMYTYGGDANLDGKINVDDYGRIDFNVGIQGAPFFTEAGAESPSLSAVPEPAGLAPLLLLFLSRRRRTTSRTLP